MRYGYPIIITQWTRRFFICALFIVLPCAYACDTGTVRDAAFVGPRDNFWIGMVFDTDDAASQARYEALAAWLRQEGAGLNVQVEHILPDDKMYLRLRYGVVEALREIPAAILAGRHPGDSRPVTLFTWTPAPEQGMLEALKSNDTLKQISRAVLEHWAVVLYARGKGVERRDEVVAAVEQWKRNHAPGAALIEFDRNVPENRFLCAATGIDSDGEDWAGVAFGKGRLMTPVLVGSAITARELDRIINRVTVPCTCIQQAAPLAFDLPMFWDEETTREALHLEVSLGYMEISLDEKLSSIFSEMPSGERTITTGALAALVAAGFAAVAALLVVYGRLRRN